MGKGAEGNKNGSNDLHCEHCETPSTNSTFPDIAMSRTGRGRSPSNETTCVDPQGLSVFVFFMLASRTMNIFLLLMVCLGNGGEIPL